MDIIFEDGGDLVVHIFEGLSELKVGRVFSDCREPPLTQKCRLGDLRFVEVHP